MVDLTDADIAEFQALFLQETGKAITREEAAAYAGNLIRLVDFVMRPGKPSGTPAS